MKRYLMIFTIAAVCFLFLGGTLAYSQTLFKIPFKFEVRGKKYPPGNYLIAQAEEDKISLQKESDGESVIIGIIEKLPPPDPSKTEPELVFDMVANFEPSYTEYITEYLLAEVWLPEMGGVLILSGERAEYTKNVKSVKQE